MSTVFSSMNAAASNNPVSNETSSRLWVAQILDILLSGRGLRMAAVVMVAFLGWKALRGLKSLFWAAFGLAWVVLWSRGGAWF